jgi:hypothetical protein
VIDVTIVLLNWNSYPVVLDAAASALGQRDVRVELIVVDNGSSDGSLAELRRRFPQARYVEMGYNSGFTGGMNAGTDAAQGEFVLWQNADLVLKDDYCGRGVAAMRADRSIGCSGGTVYRLIAGRRTNEFDACGYTLSAAHRTVFRRSGGEVVGVSGSCPLFRRTALEAIRGPVGYVLDPTYFTYGEDIDVMLRLNLGGWKVVHIPEMTAWHVRSGSTAPHSRFYEKPDVTQVHHLRNRLATIVKTWPRSVLIRRLPALVLIEGALPFYLLLRRPRSLKNWFAAWLALWGNRARLLRDRARIQAMATPAAIARLRGLLQRPA